nr:cetyl-coenzyme A carboxylase carboxyl transferase subunit beta [Equisetum xylochaetum]UVF28150.1 cetyl-coenzyme A carboxylase carboxyl transferase subunit beta [Equisetum xylochaetum]
MEQEPTTSLNQEPSTSLKDWFEQKQKLYDSVGDDLEEVKVDFEDLHPKERQRLAVIAELTRRSEGLWERCDNCESMLYVKFLKQNLSVCEECGYHLQMNSTERIEALIDPETWIPIDEDMISQDILNFGDEDSYEERLVKYQKQTGLAEAVQTGVGFMNEIPIALGVMDFKFMGGSMGSVVGEKITRLVELATLESLPLIIVCSSGGARMQEGTLSLMQMAKISSVLQIHQIQNRLLYISVLTYPTTGGVTASFGMLGDLIIAEPRAYIAFAGRRVIEQTLHEEIPEDFQFAEFLFDHGLLDLIIPRKLLKGALSELLQLYSAAPYKLNQPPKFHLVNQLHEYYESDPSHESDKLDKLSQSYKSEKILDSDNDTMNQSID